jgi:type II secretory pathway predicted ATPase ExeA
MSQLLAHFGFTHHPFGRATPSAAVLRHRGFEEAHRRMLFTLELDGIALLLAEPGCGKSLLLGELADRLQRDPDWTVHYLAHTTTGPFGLTNVLARKIGLHPKRSRSETADAILSKLTDDRSHHLLVVDEAHALPDASLEEIRLLTITDFDRHSPFRLLLAGLPELDDRLQAPLHRALDQRITAFARLQPLALDETRQYIQCRLAAAGADRPLFDDAALQLLYDAADGVPRRINTLATTSLVVAAARGRQNIGAQDIQDAALDRRRP